ncbi:MAG TPA: VIT domain-containing protein, partial [Candidatus Saccharimonadia bacterium]|nr:VIT domain-containing protein [Candidatus Saccharimonadia bacterium]
TFFNPNSRVMEGEFVFPLGEGQTVSGYALEVNGAMRQSVVVEKQKGREIFEEIVRRGIDPGLAELTRGNVFRTRIYPIMSGSTKRVSITFEQELVGEGEAFQYTLPMFIPGKLDRYRARVEVVRSQEVPFTKGNRSEPLEFKRQRDSYVAEFTKDNVEMWRPLEFQVPKRADHTQIFLVEDKDKKKPAQLYFHARLEPEIPAAPARPAPKRIAIFYDASGSPENRVRTRELEMLEAWLKRLGQVTVDLVVFRNEAEKPITFDIKDGETTALRSAIEALPLDGGTSLGAVDIRAVPEADVVVLMSDGFSTFGPAEPVLTREGGGGIAPPLFAIHAATQVDNANLERLARKTGGRVVNVLDMEVADALKTVSTMPLQFLYWDIVTGEAEDLVMPQRHVDARGFVIAGKVQGRCEIELNFGYTDAVAVRRHLTLDPEDALEPARGAFVRRAWAQCKLAELSLEARRNEAAMTALGKEHAIVTAGTSLMVLERIEDYVRHRLEPPEADLRAQYLALVKKQPPPASQANQADGRLALLYHQWQEFQAWHDAPHPWLDAVLSSAAEREAAIYAALSGSTPAKQQGVFLSVEDAAAAAALAVRAQDLSSRWPQESKDEDARAAWIQDATKVLHAVGALRQRRMELSPEMDATGMRRAGNDGLLMSSGGGFGRGTGMGGTLTLSNAMTFTGTMDMNGATAVTTPVSATAAPASRIGDKARAEGGEGIQVQAWTPDTPYLTKLRKAEAPEAAYLELRREYSQSPSFFADCAEFFRVDRKDERLALRVLSNLAELDLENPTLLRMLAFRLKEQGRHELAAMIYEEVLRMRGEEPQSRRDLALCLAALEKPDHARAVTLLWEVATSQWDARFYGIQLTALHELNDLIQHIPKEHLPDLAALGVDKRFVANIPVGLRVVLTWDADNTDVDFWVIDPGGEVCASGHNRTITGGLMTQDLARGYGPEIF